MDRVLSSKKSSKWTGGRHAPQWLCQESDGQILNKEKPPLLFHVLYFIWLCFMSCHCLLFISVSQIPKQKVYAYLWMTVEAACSIVCFTFCIVGIYDCRQHLTTCLLEVPSKLSKSWESLCILREKWNTCTTILISWVLILIFQFNAKC